MTEQDKKIKELIKNEVSPLLIGLRNEIKKSGESATELLGRLNNSLEQKKSANFLDSITQLIDFLKGAPGETPVRGKDYFTEEDIKQIIILATPVKGKDYFTEADIKKFIKIITPIKGKDYKDGEKGAMPIKGKDYFTAKEVSDFLKSITPIKGVHYKDGEPGTPGKNGTSADNLSAEDIRNRLESLTGKSRLKISAIDGLEERLNNNQSGGGSSIGGSGGGSSAQSSGVNFETPVGAKNGSNVTFTVANTPKAVLLDGMTYFLGDGAYTLSGLTITMILVPQTGSTLRSMY